MLATTAIIQRINMKNARSDTWGCALIQVAILGSQPTYSRVLKAKTNQRNNAATKNNIFFIFYSPPVLLYHIIGVKSTIEDLLV